MTDADLGRPASGPDARRASSASGGSPSSPRQSSPGPTSARRRLGLVRAVFVALAREEWRLHARLFGGARFAGVPLLFVALAVGTTVAMLETGTSPSRIVLGAHVLAAGFGLYSGTAAFAGSDMLENVFGRLSLVLSTAETLPLSRRGLLGAFLLKDGAFYALVFLLPMATAGVALAGASGSAVVPVDPLRAVGALWLSLTLAFAAGMALTVALVAARSRGLPPWTIAATAGGAVGAAWLLGLADALRPIVVPLSGSPTTALGVAGLVGGVASVAVVAFDPAAARPARTAGDRFARVSGALPLEHDALVAKTLLDLARSSGGVAKPFVSAAILLALVAALVGVVGEITGIEPAPGIFFGGVLGLSAFTTYNWLTQFDSLEAYLCFPIAIEDVFRAKRIAFVLVGGPAVALPYLVAVVRYGATALDAAVGAILLGGYGLYYYGLTVYVAGFDPNEFLFDVVRFATFTVGVAVALVPTLVAGFVVVPPTPGVAAVLAVVGSGFGGVGCLLSSKAGPRWDRRYRRE